MVSSCVSVKTGGVIRYARAGLGLSQSEFGAWLAEKVGREFPYPITQVSDWECGRKSPRLKIRLVCRELAARRANAMMPPDADKAVRIIVECQS